VGTHDAFSVACPLLVSTICIFMHTPSQCFTFLSLATAHCGLMYSRNKLLSAGASAFVCLPFFVYFRVFAFVCRGHWRVLTPFRTLRDLVSEEMDQVGQPEADVLNRQQGRKGVFRVPPVQGAWYQKTNLRNFVVCVFFRFFLLLCKISVFDGCIRALMSCARSGIL
jgi:hypothetical protein